MATILYLHGLYSRPGGLKPTFLKNAGHTVLNPHLPDDDFAESVRRAQRAFDDGHPDVVVGSSRGGAVALNIDARDVPVILIAPAWKKWGGAATVPARAVILHSEGDQVIPIAHSRELLANSGVSPQALRVVGIDHNMIDPEAFAALDNAVREAVADI
jgi:hypothetical protein